MKKMWLILAGMAIAYLPGSAKDDGAKEGNLPPVVSARVATPGIKATVDQDKIVLNDGRTFKLLRSASKYVSSQIVMTNPVGASVTISYEDGKNTFTGKVPFVYQAPASKSNEYYKLTVDEGDPLKTWHVNMQNMSNEVLTIE